MEKTGQKMEKDEINISFDEMFFLFLYIWIKKKNYRPIDQSIMLHF